MLWQREISPGPLSHVSAHSVRSVEPCQSLAAENDISMACPLLACSLQVCQDTMTDPQIWREGHLTEMLKSHFGCWTAPQLWRPSCKPVCLSGPAQQLDSCIAIQDSATFLGGSHANSPEQVWHKRSVTRTCSMLQLQRPNCFVLVANAHKAQVCFQTVMHEEENM